MRVVLGIIFGLFIICFIAIIIEECFLGGRARRRAQKEYLKRCAAEQKETLKRL